MTGSHMLTAKDIRWTPAPVPDQDTATMSDEDLLVATLIEADAYRTLAQQGIHQLHDLHREHDRLRTAHHRLIEEYRRLRTTIAVAA